MKYIGLEEIDSKILDLLQENGRMTFSDIAKQIGISGVAVKNHVMEMEQKGIIDGYSVLINPKKIESTISAYLDIQAELGSLEQVARILKEYDAITQIYLLSGEGRLHVHGVFNNNEELNEFLRNVLYPMQGVKHADCQIILSTIKDDKGIRL